MTLEEIRSLLTFRDAPDDNCGEVNALLDEHIQHVVKRIKELKLLQQNLRGLRIFSKPRRSKIVGFFGRWEVRLRICYNRRMLSIGKAACTRRIDDLNDLTSPRLGRCDARSRNVLVAG